MSQTAFLFGLCAGALGMELGRRLGDKLKKTYPEMSDHEKGMIIGIAGLLPAMIIAQVALFLIG